MVVCLVSLPDGTAAPEGGPHLPGSLTAKFPGLSSVPGTEQSLRGPSAGLPPKYQVFQNILTFYSHSRQGPGAQRR